MARGRNNSLRQVRPSAFVFSALEEYAGPQATTGIGGKDESKADTRPQCGQTASGFSDASFGWNARQFGCQRAFRFRWRQPELVSGLITSMRQPDAWNAAGLPTQNDHRARLLLEAIGEASLLRS